jgi:hypothetical protein
MKAKIAPRVELTQPQFAWCAGHGEKILTTEITEDAEGEKAN